jgi:hypothetical protein
MEKRSHLTEAKAERSRLAFARYQEKLKAREEYAGLLSVSEAAAITKRSARAINKAISVGVLPAIRGPDGRDWWIAPDDLARAFPPTIRRPNRRRPRHEQLSAEERKALMQAFGIDFDMGTPEGRAAAKQHAARERARRNAE